MFLRSIKEINGLIKVFYKKRGEWFIERQRPGTSTNKWKWVTKNDKGRQRVKKKMLQQVKSGKEWYKEWEKVTANENDWQVIK